MQEMKTFVARQPILNGLCQVVGYELLYRSSGESQNYDAFDDNQATAQVLSDSLFGVGLERITMGRPAFINFPESILVADPSLIQLLPPQSLVVEILETVEPSEPVVQACRNLKAADYRLAMDDYQDHPRFQPLLACADIVKLDVRASPLARPEQLVRGFHKGLTALAEKVETHLEFNRAKALGYTLFQGYFFARPSLVEGRSVPRIPLHCYRLLEAIQAQDLDFRKLETVIRQDVSCTYKLLRYVNSPLFGYQGTIDSIVQCLLLLGESEIRRWAALIVLSRLGHQKPSELLVLSLVRARFSEALGEMAGLATKKEGLFLLGMLSLLDALTNQEMAAALSGLPLDAHVSAVLLGNCPPAARSAYSILELVKAYENARWAEVSQGARLLGIAEDKLGMLYTDAVNWAEKAFVGHS